MKCSQSGEGAIVGIPEGLKTGAEVGANVSGETLGVPLGVRLGVPLGAKKWKHKTYWLLVEIRKLFRENVILTFRRI